MSKENSVQYLTDEEFANLENPYFSELQLMLINEPTPEEETEIKEDENGFKYKSVKGSYVKKRLNQIFSFNWDFKIIKTEYFKEANEVITEGELTVLAEKGDIVKQQYGSSLVATKNVNAAGRNFSKPLNLGHSYKASATDALKKCASEIGLFWDIYSQGFPEPEKFAEGVEELSYEEQKKLERFQHFLDKCATVKAVREFVIKQENNGELHQAYYNQVDIKIKSLQKSKK